MDANIIFTRVTPGYEHLEELFDIRDEAFPENERSTTRNIDALSENSKLVIYGIEDDNQLIGFTYRQLCNRICQSTVECTCPKKRELRLLHLM